MAVKDENEIKPKVSKQSTTKSKVKTSVTKKATEIKNTTVKKNVAKKLTEEIGYIVPKPFSNKTKILFCASEAIPFIKVGGLGDVAGSLPKALNDKNLDVRVVLPLYSQISEKMRLKMTFKCNFWFALGWRNVYCGIFQAEIDGVIYYLIDNEQYFKRGATYGQYDDGERFAFFSKAVLEIIPYIDFYPEIIHANDWHSAMVPVYLDTLFRNNPGYQSIKTVFSIHNIEFQGKYDPFILGDVFGLDERHINLLFDGDCINLMKGAIECSNVVTTVSKTYADEILTPYFGWGLETILSARSYKLKGIVNGIDEKLNSPKTDKNIKTKYTLKSISKKAENKKDLQEFLKLNTDNNAIVIGMVTRLTPQKGIDLFYQAMEEILKDNIQLIILGTGYRHFEDYLKTIESQHQDKFRAYIGFSSEMASKIYAGADLFLMPS
ncbi:MAG: glycogen/starch synthase, partial [Oscillospiraceae bacterium]